MRLAHQIVLLVCVCIIESVTKNMKLKNRKIGAPSSIFFFSILTYISKAHFTEEKEEEQNSTAIEITSIYL
jgi:hypothetical protein